MKYTILALFITLFISCSSDDTPTDYTEANEQEIVDYIANHNLDATRSNSGLYYVIDEIGSGDKITSTSDVAVIYKGYYTNGTTFDESNEDGITFNLSQNLISGFIEGIQYFNQGGIGTLLIPSHLAYGNKDYNGIPAGSVLIFDVEIIDYKAKNELEITDYITANNLTATRSETGLYYVINDEGTGTQPTPTSNVTVAYKGYFTDDEVFDESDPAGISFDLDKVIAGWTEGIPYFKEGGNGMLLIPSHLGYGIYGKNPIPSGAVLIFDINLISVN